MDRFNARGARQFREEDFAEPLTEEDMVENLDKFSIMLTRCEQVRGNVLTDWEQRFIVDLREKLDGREDQIDLGVTSWLPTRNQYNALHQIWSNL